MKHLDFLCQKSAIESLKDASNYDRHSLLICSPTGCGKSYLAKMYADMLGVSDFVIVSSSIEDIRTTIDNSYSQSNKIVFCIENIDTGVMSASFTLLKFLEEPAPNVYIVITSRNIKNVPDTIISRSYVINFQMPLKQDIETYAKEKDTVLYNKYCTKSIWKCLRSFGDVNLVYNMSPEELNYFETLRESLDFTAPVSSVIWKLQHYQDNKDTPLELVLNYILVYYNDSRVTRYTIDCINSLQHTSIAKHTILAKYVFDLKYGE